MGAIAARDLRTIQNLADHMLAISLLAAAQATDAANRLDALPPSLRAVYDGVRAVCPPTDHDRRHDVLIAACLGSYQAGTLSL